MKTKLLAVSLNPKEYDIDVIAKMNYDEADEFFRNDTTNCCNVTRGNIEDFDRLIPEGDAYDIDTLFVWFK